MYDTANHFWRNETHNQSHYGIRWLGYVDLTCCAIIVISNTLVILVFSRKRMASPVNNIFINLALTQLLSCLAYIPHVWQELIRTTTCSIQEHRTYIWEEMAFISYMVALMLRIITVWMTVMLAVWRYIAILHPFKEPFWCNTEITRRLIISGYIFGVITVVAPCFGSTVGECQKLVDDKGCITSNYSTGRNVTIYELQLPIENYPTMFAIAFAFYGVFIKLLPFVTFVFINYRLINYLTKVKKHEMVVSRQLSSRTQRTAKSLVFILLLFMVREVPHGIFALLSAYCGPKFFWKHYYYGKEINNCLLLITECFNFIILYSMSANFRKTFNNLARITSNRTDFNTTIPSFNSRFVPVPFD